MTDGVYTRLLDAILTRDPAQKCARVRALHSEWGDGSLAREEKLSVESIDDPGRPEKPDLVDPREVPRRTLATEDGRVAMLHAFAHIEFNAINLALDAAYRFRDMPDDFVGDWIRVAVEEVHHFELIRDYLNDLDADYGDYPAHNGLWDMVCKTRHDVLHRMALVPRVMEARGLDVTPGLMEKFAQFGDTRSVDILRVIYDEEIGHVTIGNHWYHFCCAQRGLEPRTTFRELIEQYFGGPLRGPFNHAARIEAGFDMDEINQLENCLCS